MHIVKGRLTATRKTRRVPPFILLNFDNVKKQLLFDFNRLIYVVYNSSFNFALTVIINFYAIEVTLTYKY